MSWHCHLIQPSPKLGEVASLSLFHGWRNRLGEDKQLAKLFLKLGRRVTPRRDKAHILTAVINCLPCCWRQIFTSACHFLYRPLSIVHPQQSFSWCYTLWSEKKAQSEPTHPLFGSLAFPALPSTNSGLIPVNLWLQVLVMVWFPRGSFPWRSWLKPKG